MRSIKEMNKRLDERETEIERLNNIINELEIWLINEMKFQEIVERDYGFRKSYYKLQELKGSDK